MSEYILLSVPSLPQFAKKKEKKKTTVTEKGETG